MNPYNRTTHRRCALILAGGHSQRMGEDKARLSFQGTSLLERAVAFWRSCDMEQIYVSLAPGSDLPLPSDVTPIYDVISDRGPLGGLYSAFRTTDAPLLWISGVDMPFLSKDAVLPEPQGDAVVYRMDGNPQPLFGVYRRSILPQVEHMLQQGDCRMTALLQQVDTEWVDAPNSFAPVFLNWNAPEDILRSLAGSPPMISVAGWSGTGKTTFLEQLIPALKQRGLRVAVVKHSHHPAQPEHPDKDTARLRRSGADAVLFWNGFFQPEAIRAQLPDTDLILVEGFKSEPIPKLALHRMGTPVYSPEDTTVIAHITDKPLVTSRPQLGWNQSDLCAEQLFCLFHLKKQCEA